MYCRLLDSHALFKSGTWAPVDTRGKTKLNPLWKTCLHFVSVSCSNLWHETWAVQYIRWTYCSLQSNILELTCPTGLTRSCLVSTCLDTLLLLEVETHAVSHHLMACFTLWLLNIRRYICIAFRMEHLVNDNDIYLDWVLIVFFS